ncbi:protein tesmin/TSO1-like CXC 4 [Malania oleifera]|uniref:protein tesmin/TSO1-like CXC 4 n=1 Tax=Malania oleifera TaxID=397392 RepID=UPI0025ADC7FA|nr:protein tesmin/TSO1-like CXC 4 [Malania oleifera]
MRKSRSRVAVTLMDSPEGRQVAATPSVSSPTVEDSPFFNFLSTLSPIKSVKSAHLAHRFSEANFPPPQPVFTSPRMDQPREASSLESRKVVAASSDVCGQCDFHFNNAGLVPCSERGIQPVSSSWKVNEYLADAVQVDSMKCSELNLKPANDAPHMLQSVQRNDERCSGFTYYDSKKFKVETDMLLGPAVEQHYGQFVSQNSGIRQDEWVCMSEPSLESSLLVGTSENSYRSSRSASKGLTEVFGHQQRGTRRHLQFEAVQSHSPCNQMDYTANLRLPARHTNMESLLLSYRQPRECSSSLLSVNHSNAMTSQSSLCPAKTLEACSEMLRHVLNDGNSSTSAPMTSGIGLHLNSIGKTVSMGSNAIKPSASIPEKVESHNLINESNSNSTSDSVTTSSKILDHTDNYCQESQAVAAVKSVVEPLNSSLDIKLIKQQTTIRDNNMTASEGPHRIEVLNQRSPKEKRKRATYSNESGGCKRCTCKRSKCLKLYCECFAVGIYCADSCACQSCFNRPEYEDKVLDTRQQIGSRNPLAFVPKIEEGNGMTPSSARHKRGCNCKKSKCLKKYCECYQARVRCSDGCRCEGCKNSFGAKAETAYGNVSSEERLDTMDAGTILADEFKLPFLGNGGQEMISYDHGLDCCTVRLEDQFSPTWEGLADININYLTPLSYPQLATASLVSANPVDCARVSQDRFNEGSCHQSPGGSFHWHASSTNLTRNPPKLI